MSEDTTPRDEEAARGFLDWTFERVRNAWRDVAESARDVISSAPRPELSDEDAARLRGQIQACLDAVGGCGLGPGAGGGPRPHLPVAQCRGAGALPQAARG